MGSFRELINEISEGLTIEERVYQAIKDNFRIFKNNFANVKVYSSKPGVLQKVFGTYVFSMTADYNVNNGYSVNLKDIGNTIKDILDKNLPGVTVYVDYYLTDWNTRKQRGKILIYLSAKEMKDSVKVVSEV